MVTGRAGRGPTQVLPSARFHGDWHGHREGGTDDESLRKGEGTGTLRRWPAQPCDSLSVPWGQRWGDGFRWTQGGRLSEWATSHTVAGEVGRQ